jgi:DNA-binding LacI/PurR family transcriptional regulator
VFLRQGHRRLAFVGPDWNVAGDLVSEEGFQEGTVGRPGVKTTLLRHTGTPVDLAAKLSALFRSPSPPTALLVARPAHTLLVLLHLLRHGIRVPDDVSVIARDHDPLYESALDHYAFDATTFAHRLSRLVLQLVGAGQLRAEPHLIFPRYVALNTVRAIRG